MEKNITTTIFRVVCGFRSHGSELSVKALRLDWSFEGCEVKCYNSKFRCYGLRGVGGSGCGGQLGRGALDGLSCKGLRFSGFRLLKVPPCHWSSVSPLPGPLSFSNTTVVAKG